LSAEVANHGDPVIERDDVFEDIYRVLGRRDKPNALLVGKPGVGKTTIAIGLAAKILARETPEFLFGRSVQKLNTHQIVADAGFRGEFEGRLQAVLGGCMETRSILFIDELHESFDVGDAEGAVNLAAALLPRLTSHEFAVIRATTREGYEQSIEPYENRDRRFRLINVSEPTPETTLRMVLGKRAGYESHHGVKYDDDALKAAVYESARLRRNLPDRAFDLVDEAGAEAKIRGEQRITKKDVKKLIRRLEADGSLYSDSLLTASEIATFMSVAKDEIDAIVDVVCFVATLIEPFYARRGAQPALASTDENVRAHKVDEVCQQIRKTYDLGDVQKHALVTMLSPENGRLNAFVLSGLLDATLELRGYIVGEGSGSPPLRTERGDIRTRLLFSEATVRTKMPPAAAAISREIVEGIVSKYRDRLLGAADTAST
jgi:ATP-dependent Clp protease ATP-binding subunit ClpA